MTKRWVPCFKSLPDMSSIPAVLLTLHVFRRFEIVFNSTLFKFSSLRLNSKVCNNSFLQPIY